MSGEMLSAETLSLLPPPGSRSTGGRTSVKLKTLLGGMPLAQEERPEAADIGVSPKVANPTFELSLCLAPLQP